MDLCKRCVVSGHVQGVFYRASTQKKALELGVRGWVRNRSDGTVEVYACGVSAKVEALCHWLWLGPSGASIVDVRCEPASETCALNGFQIRSTQ